MVFSRELEPYEKEALLKMEGFVKHLLAKNDSHDFSHVLTVTRYAIDIAKNIPDKVDPFVVISAALLHDIGKFDKRFGNVHGFFGASLAEEFLESLNIEEEKIDRICRAIVRHTPTSMIPPKTPAEKIVFDADCLDRLGIMGLLRGFIGKTGSMEEIMLKYMDKRTTDYSKLNFEYSKEIGDWKQQELEGFIPFFKKRLQDRMGSIKNIFDECDW